MRTLYAQWRYRLCTRFLNLYAVSVSLRRVNYIGRYGMLGLTSGDSLSSTNTPSTVKFAGIAVVVPMVKMTTSVRRTVRVRV